jgi:prophage regulatory protein
LGWIFGGHTGIVAPMFDTAQRGANVAQVILRLPAVKGVSGYSRSTIYLRIAQRLWTKQVSLGSRAVGWPSDEVAALNAARIVGKSDDEIRSLVVRLEAARKTPPLRLNQGSVETASQGG